MDWEGHSSSVSVGEEQLGRNSAIFKYMEPKRDTIVKMYCSTMRGSPYNSTTHLNSFISSDRLWLLLTLCPTCLSLFLWGGCWRQTYCVNQGGRKVMSIPWCINVSCFKHVLFFQVAEMQPCTALANRFEMRGTRYMSYTSLVLLLWDLKDRGI